MSSPNTIESNSIVVVKIAFADPSNDAVPVTSPCSVIFLAVANAVAVSALPTKSPVNVVNVASVPSSVVIYPSAQYALEEPIFFVLLPDGIKSDANCAFNVIVSELESPNSVFPVTVNVGVVIPPCVISSPVETNLATSVLLISAMTALPASNTMFVALSKVGVPVPSLIKLSAVTDPSTSKVVPFHVTSEDVVNSPFADAITMPSLSKSDTVSPVTVISLNTSTIPVPTATSSRFAFELNVSILLPLN